MALLLPTLDTEIAGQEPWVDGALFAEAEHCLDFAEPFDPDAIARSLLQAAGKRATDSLKVQCRAFQLILTLSRRGQEIPLMASISLRQSMGLGRRASRIGRAISAAFTDAQELRPGANAIAERSKIQERQLYNWRADRDYQSQRKTFGQMLSVDPTLDKLSSWPNMFDTEVAAVGGIDMVARKIISHVRAARKVAEGDRLAAMNAIGWCQRHHELIPEALLSALAYVTNVVEPSTGKPSERAMGSIWGTRTPGKFRRWAEQDAVAEATTGRPKWQTRGPDKESDRTAHNFRRRPAYNSLKSDKL